MASDHKFGVRFPVHPTDGRVRCDFNGLPELDNEEGLSKPTTAFQLDIIESPAVAPQFVGVPKHPVRTRAVLVTASSLTSGVT
jgi:hypothetical protein